MRVFVTTGSRSFSFDRLVKAIDKASFGDALGRSVEVLAQIGASEYRPESVEYVDFLSRLDFHHQIAIADVVITHGGTGAIIGAVTKGKKVVAVPRLAEFNEAVDDHQIELVRQLDAMGLIKGCFDLEKLAECTAEAVNSEFRPYKSNTENVLDSIDDFIVEELMGGERK